MLAKVVVGPILVVEVNQPISSLACQCNRPLFISVYRLLPQRTRGLARNTGSTGHSHLKRQQVIPSSAHNCRHPVTFPCIIQLSSCARGGCLSSMVQRFTRLEYLPNQSINNALFKPTSQTSHSHVTRAAKPFPASITHRPPGIGVELGREFLMDWTVVSDRYLVDRCEEMICKVNQRRDIDTVHTPSRYNFD